MATAAGEGTSYECGGGAGGKFRKRPFRRPRPTPFDRPQTAIRNPRTNSWLSKLVDPASRLIASSAHLFFSSVFRKRLPPPPLPLPLPPPHSSEAYQESRNRLSQEEVPNNSAGVQGTAIKDDDKQTNFEGLSELEQILKHKAFTRSEIDRLTELLHSRTFDSPNVDEDIRTESNLLQPASSCGRQSEFDRIQMQENKTESHLESHRFPGCTSTPVVNSPVLAEDVATPAELAKAYMGSRPSKVSPSMLSSHNQAFREDSTLPNNLSFSSVSPIKSLVPKPAVCLGVTENSFMTPKSRGRSAIYNMARTPYSRIHPTGTQKVTSSNYDGFGGPPASSSSSKFAWEHDSRYGSKPSILKRRSSVFEDDIGSVGPIRRLRQKTNLATPKNFILPVSGSALSIHGNGVGPHAVQSAQKLPKVEESKHRISKALQENEDSCVPSTSYTSVPSKSTEMATKILEQLERLVPKEKSSEGTVVAVREKSPSMLTPNMLHGQALRSLEDVDSSKILHYAKDGHKLKDMPSTSLPDGHHSLSPKQDKVEENGPNRFITSRELFSLAGTRSTSVSAQKMVPGGKTVDSVSAQIFVQPSQKKRAFQMSAHEDFVDLDDEIGSNEAASTLLADGKKILTSSVVESKAVSSQAVTVDKTSVATEFTTPAISIFEKSAGFGTSDVAIVDVRDSGFTFPSAPASSTIFQPAMPSLQSTSVTENIVPPKEPNASAPLFSGSKDDKISLSTASSVCESAVLILSAPSEPKPERKNSLANGSSGATDLVPKVIELNRVDGKIIQKCGDIVGKSETSVSSGIATSTSASSIFSFGAPAKNKSLTNGSLDLTPSILSPPPLLASGTSTNQTFTNSFTNVASSTAATMITNGNATTTASNTSDAAPLFPAGPFFKFGSTATGLSNTNSTVSTASHADATDLKAKTEKETTSGNLTSTPFGGTSSAMTSTGSSIFGLSASASSSSANSLSPGSLFGTSSGSLVSTQASPAGTGVATITQSIPFQFASSSSSSIFGTSGVASFTSGSSLFGSSTSISAGFGSSTSSSTPFGLTPNVFGASSTLGMSSSASSSGTSSVSSSGATTSLFDSGWQPAKSPISSSTFSAVSPSTVFSFGASSVPAAPTPATNSAPTVFGASTGASSGSLFSFTSAAATASSQVQPVFASSSVPVFMGASGNNGDQVNMEDSMAEDPVQASTPTGPVFGQPPIATPSSGFVFGSSAPSPAGLPFQFGGQQNQNAQQNPSPFQASGSVDFGGGGSSFSLGSTGGDKGSRRIFKPKHNKTRRR